LDTADSHFAANSGFAANATRFRRVVLNLLSYRG
jgi:hypothetical protein